MASLKENQEEMEKTKQNKKNTTKKEQT